MKGASEVAETTDRKADRSDVTRERLLVAAVDVFGLYGFAGATTRMLTDAAGVNQQAIPYHFGNKLGLHIAAAEYIGGQIKAHVGDLRGHIEERLRANGDAALPKPEARALLTQLLQAMTELFVNPRSESWARFLIREQMQPSEAFDRIYGGVMSPLLDIAARMVGSLLEESPSSEHVRLRTVSLLGGLLIFRMAHAAVMAKLDWSTIGPDQLSAIKGLASELVSSLEAGREAA